MLAVVLRNSSPCPRLYPARNIKILDRRHSVSRGIHDLISEAARGLSTIILGACCSDSVTMLASTDYTPISATFEYKVKPLLTIVIRIDSCTSYSVLFHLISAVDHGI